jgi:hypothetical protein
VNQALQTALIAKSQRMKGDLRPSKFLPAWEGPRAQTADEMVEALRSIARRQKKNSGH